MKTGVSTERSEEEASPAPPTNKLTHLARSFIHTFMKPRHKLIVILLVIAALLIAYEHKKNGRRIMSITSSPQSLSFAPPTPNTTSTEPSTLTIAAPGTPKPTKPVVTVGVILPLTGVQSVYGQGIKEGLDLAAKGVNETEKFRIRVKLAYEDTASEPKNAPAAARKLIDRDQATLLITGLSPTSLAVAPIAEEKKIVLFTMASLASALNSAGSFVFKNDDVSSKLGDGLANAALAAGTKNSAILYANYNDSVIESKTAFAKTLAANGGAVTGEQGFTQDTTDFRTILGKLIAPQPASIAIFGLQRDCALATEQLRDLGYRGQLYGFTCMDDPEVITAAKQHLEGAVFVSFNGIPSPKFSQLTQNAYGHEPLRFSAEAFDGLKLMALALLRAYDGKHPITSEALRETLTHLTSYSGEAGSVTFDAEGNATRSLYVKTMKNGKIEIVP